MVDGEAVVVMKEPWRLPGGGVETGLGAVGRGQQEVDALSPGLAQLSPSPTPSTPSPLPGKAIPRGSMEGESQGPGLKVGRGTKTLESSLSSGGNRAWCWEAELGLPSGPAQHGIHLETFTGTLLPDHDLTSRTKNLTPGSLQRLTTPHLTFPRKGLC